MKPQTKDSPENSLKTPAETVGHFRPSSLPDKSKAFEHAKNILKILRYKVTGDLYALVSEAYANAASKPEHALEIALQYSDIDVRREILQLLPKTPKTGKIREVPEGRVDGGHTPSIVPHPSSPMASVPWGGEVLEQAPDVFSGEKSTISEDEAARRNALVEWENTLGVETESCERLWEIQGMTWYWHMAQVVSNAITEVCREIPLSVVGLTRSDLTTEGLLAIKQSFTAFDPRIHGSFESFALPFVERAAILHVIEKARQVLPDLIRCKQFLTQLDEIDPVKLASQIEQYEKALEIAALSRKSRKFVDETLAGLSKQEQLMVTLHEKKDWESAEIAEAVGMSIQHVCWTLKRVAGDRQHFVAGESMYDSRQPRQGITPRIAPPAEGGISMESIEATMGIRIFPGKDALYDLDKYYGGKASTGPDTWIAELQTAERANRLLAVIRAYSQRNRRRDAIIKYFGHVQHPRTTDQRELDHIVHEILDRPDVAIAKILAFARNPHTAHSHISSGETFRGIEERHLLLPNIRGILENAQSHAMHHPDARTLLDFKTGTGTITKGVSDLFTDIRALEENEGKCERLEQGAPPHLRIFRQSIGEVIRRQGYPLPPADAILLTHVLDGHRSGTGLLQISCELLYPGGVIVITLDNPRTDPYSSALMRRKLGVGIDENAPTALSRFFLKRNMRTRIIRATLRMEANTQGGQGALRDVLFHLLPEDAQRGCHRDLDAFVEDHLRDERSTTQTLTHSTLFLVVEKAA